MRKTLIEVGGALRWVRDNLGEKKQAIPTNFFFEKGDIQIWNVKQKANVQILKRKENKRKEKRTDQAGFFR